MTSHWTTRVPDLRKSQDKAVEDGPVPQGREPVARYVGRTGGDICPVAALLSYLVCRPGPLFIKSDGRPLTRKFCRVGEGRFGGRQCNVDQQKYCGHSFRIGAATTAAAKGVEDSVIKARGRRESTAFLQYVRNPREQLTGYARVLVAP